MADNQLLKRRIIGATVLVGLAVIFIPMILSGGRDEMSLFGSNIPDKPKSIEKLRSIEIPKPAAPERPVELRVPVDENLPEARVENKQLANKPSSASEKLGDIVQNIQGKDNKAPKVWAVQVGSFSNRNNALALQKKLRKNKFPAFVEYVKNTRGSVYRVRVGPESQRKKAEMLLADIKKKLDMNGVVTKHP